MKNENCNAIVASLVDIRIRGTGKTSAELTPVVGIIVFFLR